MVYEAFYASAAGPMPMTLREVTTYTWLGQAMLGLMPWYIDPEDPGAHPHRGSRVRAVAGPPTSTPCGSSAQSPCRAAPTLLRSLPIFIVAGLFLGLEPPPSAAAALAWAAATFCALLLSGAITNLMAITLMWTVSGEGDPLHHAGDRQLLLRAVPAAAADAGLGWNGSPALLPFRGLIDIPFRLYLRDGFPCRSACRCSCTSSRGSAVLVLAGRRALARGTRRLVLQGG